MLVTLSSMLSKIEGTKFDFFWGIPSFVILRILIHNDIMIVFLCIMYPYNVRLKRINEYRLIK
jgi:hypothetical protein